MSTFMSWFGIMLLTILVIAVLSKYIRIRTKLHISTATNKLCSGQVVPAKVTNAFTETGTEKQFIVQLDDGSHWDVFDNSREYTIGDIVYVKRLCGRQVFV